MSGAVAEASHNTVVRGGEIVVDVIRAPCPEDERPCEEECPYPVEAFVGQHILRPEPTLFRGIGSRLYCQGLKEGIIEYKSTGGELAVEVEVGPEVPGADLRPVTALLLDLDGTTHTVSLPHVTRPLEVRAMMEDLRQHGRVGRQYGSSLSWRPEPTSEPRPRRGRSASARVGNEVALGELPEDVLRIPLDQPEPVVGTRPLTKVVLLDVEGLELARRAAAAAPDREIAFFLLGRMEFDRRSGTLFTTVARVVPVEEHEYERSDAARCEIGPAAFARARALSKAENLQVVGVIHSHVLEVTVAADDESEESRDEKPKHGLFYSSTDIADHERLFTAALSLGGVLNLRPTADDNRTSVEVQTALFSRDESGSFVPVEYLLIPKDRSPQ